MTNYVKFIKWCFNGVTLSHPVTRIVLYLGFCLLGAMAFGPDPIWAALFSLAIAVDLLSMMIAWKYEEFKREQKDNL